MDDNVRPQRNREAPNTLEKEEINCIQWLAYSLDLNPFRYACDVLCKRVSQITRLPLIVQKLKIALREDWDNIPLKDFPIV